MAAVTRRLPARAVLLVLALLSFAGRLPAQTSSALSGRVLTKTLSPVAGARVVVVSPDGNTAAATETDAQGGFSVATLPRGTYTVRVERGGAVPAPARQVRVEGTGTRVEITLADGSQSLPQLLVQGKRTYGARAYASATKLDAPALDVPQSAQVITEDFLDDQNATDLTDIFRNVSGVNAFTANQDYTIRGFRTQEVLYNGQRAPTSFLFSPPGTALIERVEVLKGPAAVLYGSFEPGGVINVITKRPSATRSRNVSVLAGSYDRYGAEADVTGPVAGPGLFGRVVAAYTRSGSYRPYDDARSAQLAPSLSWQATPNTVVRLNGEFVDNRLGYERGIPAPGGDVHAVPITWTLSEPGDFVKHRGVAAEAGVEQHVADDWQLRGTVRYSSTDTRQWSHDAQEVVQSANGAQLSRIFYDYPWHLRFVTPSLNLAGAFATGALRHSVLAGADGRVSTLDSRSRAAYAGVPALDLDHPEHGTTSPERYEFTPADWTTDTRSLGAYVQDLAAIGRRLKVLVGARYDRVREDLFYEEGEYRVDERVRAGALSLRGGAVLQPTSTLSLYASYSEGFKAEGMGWVQGDGGPYDPERSNQVEVGGKAEWFGGRLTSTASLYRIRKTNVLVDDPSTETPRYLQVGEVRSQGAELDLAGALLPQWSLVANYAFNDIETTRDTDPAKVGKPFPNAPRHSASLWTRYDLPGLPLGLGGGGRYVSERTTFDATRLPTYAVYDAAAYYWIGATQLTLKVNNLFDTVHFLGGYGEATIIPGAPRTVSLRASVAF